MATIGTATTYLNSSAYDSARGADAEVSALGKSSTLNTSREAESGSDSEADTVVLSERAQAILARAKTEQAVVAQLAKILQGSQSEGGSSPARNGLEDPSEIFKAIAERQQKDADSSSETSAHSEKGVTKTQNYAPYGNPNISDGAFKAEITEYLLNVADGYDQAGRPPEVGQALRDAVRNGTIKIEAASDVADLNYHTTHSFTNSVHGGGYDSFSSWTLTPKGAPKEALDAGRAIAMWNYNRGDLYISW